MLVAWEGLSVTEAAEAFSACGRVPWPSACTGPASASPARSLTHDAPLERR